MTTRAQHPAAAKLHLDNGDLERAKESIDKSIADPQYAAKPVTWYYRGLIYQQLAAGSSTTLQPATISHLRNAHEAYRKAMALGPDDKSLQQNAVLGCSILFEIAAEYAARCYEAADSSRSLEAFALAADIKPTDLGVLTIASAMALNQQQCPLFVALLEQLIAQPMNAYEQYNAIQYTDLHLQK